MSEWKPGDVAMVAGMRAMYGGAFGAVPQWQFADSSRCNADAVAVPIDRRLVVIDPEDAEAVERLASLLARFGAHRGRTQKVSEREGIARALRELDAAPRIEEPQGLGAVVEDAQGHYWVRSDGAATRGTVWRFAGRLLAWRDLDVVRVLSEGVTP